MARSIEDAVSGKEISESSKTDTKRSEEEKKKEDDKKESKGKKDDKTKSSINEIVKDDFEGHLTVMQSGPKNIDYNVEQEVKKQETQAMPFDYNTLKSNVERLSNYQELSRQYSLTQEQIETVRDIYSQIMNAEGAAKNLDDKYRSLSDSIKEMSDMSKRIISSIADSYIKDISDYRHTP